jgi:hypothetical protein
MIVCSSARMLMRTMANCGFALSDDTLQRTVSPAGLSSGHRCGNLSRSLSEFNGHGIR